MSYPSTNTAKPGPWLWLTMISAMATVAMIYIMMKQGAPLLLQEHGIRGQVTLEFAGNKQRMLEIIDAWNARGLTVVIRKNIRLDYLFLFAYSAFLLCGYRLLSSLYPLVYKRTFIKWLLFCVGPGILDCIENLAMDYWITHDGHGIPPQVILVMVVVKFTCALGMATVIMGGLLNLVLQKLMRF